MKLPHLSEDLIKELDRRYPVYQPKVTDTIEFIQRKAGQREVVEQLVTLLKIQQSQDD